MSLNSPHYNPSPLWLLPVAIFLAVIAYMSLSIAGHKYGVGPLAPTTTPTPTVTPTAVPTPTPVPEPQPELVTAIEAQLNNEWDITDVYAESSAIYIVTYAPQNFSSAVSREHLDEADRLMFELLKGIRTTQTSVAFMYFHIAADGELRFFWITVCNLDRMLGSSEPAAACDGLPSDEPVPTGALRWANKSIP